MERKFKFTIELSHQAYVALLEESRHREGSDNAVPSRTARQLISERLGQLAKKKALLDKKQSDKVAPLVVEPIEGIEGTTATRLNTTF